MSTLADVPPALSGCFYLKRDDEQYRYTSVGVRFKQEMISNFKEIFLQFQSLITSVRTDTKDVFTSTTAHLIGREISRLSNPNCYGCEIEHSSQKQHMGEGGCLSQSQPRWNESCQSFFQAAKRCIKDDDVQNLARSAVALIPELQVTYISGLVTVCEISDEDLQSNMARGYDIEQPLSRVLADLQIK